MKLRSFLMLVLTGLFLSLPAFAMTLEQARGSGLVGEKLDGYAAVMKPTPEVQTLVADVNAKRQQEYSRISQQNGQPVDVVAKLAAQEIINKLPKGAFYQSPDNGWKRR